MGNFFFKAIKLNFPIKPTDQKGVFLQKKKQFPVFFVLVYNKKYGPFLFQLDRS